MNEDDRRELERQEHDLFMGRLWAAWVGALVAFSLGVLVLGGGLGGVLVTVGVWCTCTAIGFGLSRMDL